MAEGGTSRATVALHAPRSAFLPGVLTSLGRLGYDLRPPEEAEQVAQGRPLLRIVDDRQLGEVPFEVGPDTPPIVLLTRHRGPATDDVRAIGIVRRRARLKPVYTFLQRASEAHPRGTPRARTDLPATSSRDGQQWVGAIHSLSENGCRVRGMRGLEEDRRIDLSFWLPGTGMLTLPAQARIVRADHAILVFGSALPETRDAIAGYVQEQLAGA